MDRLTEEVIDLVARWTVLRLRLVVDIADGWSDPAAPRFRQELRVVEDELLALGLLRRKSE